MLHNRRTPGTAGPAGSSWAARYGQVILAHGIAALPTALYYYQGRLQLSAQEVWFVSYILAHKWDAALPHPSLKKMSHYTGMSLSQLKRIRAGLCSKGYLRIEERYGSSGDQERTPTISPPCSAGWRRFWLAIRRRRMQFRCRRPLHHPPRTQPT